MRRQVLTVMLVAAVACGDATRARAWNPRGGAGGQRGAQGYLGVDVRDLNEDEQAQLKSKDAKGAEIVRLDHDGPASKAGVREHDVVLQMDGRPVEGRDQFRRMLREEPAGHPVVLVLLRDGQQQTVRATMANREDVERQAWEQHIAVVDPDGPPAALPPPPTPPPTGRVHAGLGFLHGGSGATEPAGGRSHSFLGTMLGAPYIGAVVEPVGPQLGEFFGVPSGVGLLVKSVDANSPAADSGMRAGDVVIKANQMTMATEGDWTRSLHESKGRPMPVLVLRDKKEQTLTLTPDAKRKASLCRPNPGTMGGEASPGEMDLL